MATQKQLRELIDDLQSGIEKCVKWAAEDLDRDFRNHSQGMIEAYEYVIWRLRDLDEMALCDFCGHSKTEHELGFPYEGCVHRGCTDCSRFV